MMIVGIVYLIGFVASAAYMFWWLHITFSNEDFEGRDYRFEGFAIGMLSVFWPVFVAYLVASKFNNIDERPCLSH